MKALQTRLDLILERIESPKFLKTMAWAMKLILGI